MTQYFNLLEFNGIDLPKEFKDRVTDKDGALQLTPAEHKCFMEQTNEYQEYLKHSAFWVWGNVTNELHHFYKVVGFDLFNNPFTLQNELWLQV